MEITETQKEISALLSAIITGADAETKLCDLVLKYPEGFDYLNTMLDNRNEIKHRQSVYSSLWLVIKKELEKQGIDTIETNARYTKQEWIEHFANASYEELMKIRKQIWKPLPFWKVIRDLIVNRY